MADSINHSRRGFLRGRFKSDQPPPLRPPWALPEAEFLAKCTRCNNCAIICPTKIIVMRDGYPQVDFSAGACTFCGECARVCTPGALPRGDDRPPWAPRAIRARISGQCLAERGVECRICGEQCEADAIRFPPRFNAPPKPVVNADTCTGCGACVAPCPSRAVTVT